MSIFSAHTYSLMPSIRKTKMRRVKHVDWHRYLSRKKRQLQLWVAKLWPVRILTNYHHRSSSSLLFRRTIALGIAIAHTSIGWLLRSTVATRRSSVCVCCVLLAILLLLTLLAVLFIFVAVMPNVLLLKLCVVALPNNVSFKKFFFFFFFFFSICDDKQNCFIFLMMTFRFISEIF